MKQSDVQYYKREGYLTLDNFINGREIKILLDQLPMLMKIKDARKVLERSGAVRSIYGVHQVNKTFEEFSSLERIIRLVEQLLGSSVYIHQSKINIKKAFTGDWWEWHQDYPYWLLGDGMAKCQVISVMILLDEANEFNGPLHLVPGSHKAGIVPFQEKLNEVDGKKSSMSGSLSRDLKYTIREDVLKRWIKKRGIATITGKPGTAVFFHGNIFHASNSNIFPSDRKVLIITYNSIHNKPGKVNGKRRPDFLASRDFTPVIPVTDTLLPSRPDKNVISKHIVNGH